MSQQCRVWLWQTYGGGYISCCIDLGNYWRIVIIAAITISSASQISSIICLERRFFSASADVSTICELSSPRAYYWPWYRIDFTRAASLLSMESGPADIDSYDIAMKYNIWSICHNVYCRATAVSKRLCAHIPPMPSPISIWASWQCTNWTGNARALNGAATRVASCIHQWRITWNTRCTWTLICTKHGNIWAISTFDMESWRADTYLTYSTACPRRSMSPAPWTPWRITSRHFGWAWCTSGRTGTTWRKRLVW